MKKRFFALGLAAVISVSQLFACSGGTGETVSVPADTEQTAGEVTPEGESSGEAGEEENFVGMANPWRETDAAEAKGACARLFKIPDGAELMGWYILDDAADVFGTESPVVEAEFSLDDLIFDARAVQGVSEDTDISGMYYDWDVQEDVTLNNWGGGNMQGTLYYADTDTGAVELLTWYDVEIGIGYCLSTAAADLDGFDIRAVAEAMYDATGEAGAGEFLRDDPEAAAHTVIEVLGDYLSDVYGNDVTEILITVEKVYDTEDLQGDMSQLIELENLSDEDVAFEVSYELVPAEGADTEMLMIPDGELDEESGHIVNIYRLGVLRPDANGNYEVTDLGTGW